MFCTQCGKQLPDDSIFCDRCGNKVRRERIVIPAAGRPAEQVITGFTVEGLDENHMPVPQVLTARSMREYIGEVAQDDQGGFTIKPQVPIETTTELGVYTYYPEERLFFLQLEYIVNQRGFFGDTTCEVVREISQVSEEETCRLVLRYMLERKLPEDADKWDEL